MQTTTFKTSIKNLPEQLRESLKAAVATSAARRW
jgi:hypothetical protein